MQNCALVSVVIPSFNHKRYIGQAIESVLNQTCPQLECVVIDDGSSDGSYEYILERFGGDPRVKATRRENRGAHQTINEAIFSATGDYISILNSDDFYEPTRLAVLVEAAARHPGPFFGISALNLVDENGVVFDPSSGYNEYYDMVCALSAGKPDVFGLWCGNIAVTTSNFFFSRSVLAEVGPFKALRYAHDWDWALHAASKFNVRRITDKLLNYRIHGANTLLEDDHWAHVAEDAYVWACALRRQKTGLPKFFDESAQAHFFGSLSKNWGFPPLPTLALLADPRSEGELLDLLGNGKLKEEMRTLFEGMAEPMLAEPMPGLLRSTRDLRRQLDASALERGALSDELASIRKSSAWKVFGWLWRLETRGSRRRKARLPDPEQQNP